MYTMYAESIREPLKTGFFFGIIYSAALFAYFPYENFFLEHSGLPDWLTGPSRLSLLAATLWSAFLFFNRRYPELPAHFPHHLLIGIAFAFSAAMISGLSGFLFLSLYPSELEALRSTMLSEWQTHGLDPGEIARQTEHYPLSYAIARYSDLFFRSFCLSMVLSTVSCIWECSRAK